MRISSSLFITALGVSTTAAVFVACTGDTSTVVPGADSGGGADTSTADAPVDALPAPDTGIADSNVADTADATPPWTPASLNGLSAWFDGNKDVSVANGTVQNWKDQSSNNNNAFNLTPANQPTTVGNVVNGRSVIRFDGAGKQWLNVFDAATLQFGTGDFAIVEVMAYTNVASSSGTTGYGALWVKTQPQAPYTGAAMFGNDPTVPSSAIRTQLKLGLSVNSSKTGYNDGSFHIVGMRRTGTTLEARGDGTSNTTANASTDVSAVASDIWIGGRGNGAQALKGDIAEIVVVKGTLSDPNLATLEGYLKAKYAL